MGNPTCPVHQKEMRSGKYGYFCPTKQEDGSWCDWSAKADGVPYQKAPRAQKFDSGATSPAPRANPRPNVDWDRLGKIKALCGMANARLSAGKTAMDVISELPSFESLLAAIESKVSPKPPGVEIHVDEDLPF
jgi:hypothetical protein